MKSCPGCEFLIDDAEERCEYCASDPNYATELKGFATKTVVGALADSSIQFSGAVGVLERPEPAGVDWSATEVAPLKGILPSKTGAGAVDSADDPHQFRRERKPIPARVVVGLVLVAIFAISGLSVYGYGPLAGQFAKIGLSRVHNVALPGQWQDYTDIAGNFTSELPVGSTVVFEPLDETGQTPGFLVGSRVDGTAGAYLLAGSSDLGLSSAGLAPFDSEAGVAELASRFAAIRIPGEVTISRPAALPYGEANDSVYVKKNSDGSVSETRLRVILSGGRLYQLVTSGPDSAAVELDAAHRRLVESFRPKL